MNARSLKIAILAIVILGLALTAAAAENKIEPKNLPSIDLRLQTFFLYRNDADFDRSKPLYDEYGQSVGYFATIFEPTLDWQPIEQVTLRYGARIGENLWSRNDAEQNDPEDDSVQVLQHREIWGQVMFNEAFGVRAGYQHIVDPTRLFVDRYMGAATMFYEMKKNKIEFTVGQFPDAVYETTGAQTAAGELQQNNFEQDIFLLALRGEFRSGYDVYFFPGFYALFDNSEINREKTLFNPCLRLAYFFNHGTMIATDLAFQWGTYKQSGPNNEDLDLMSGAAEVSAFVPIKRVSSYTDLLLLTSDDGDRNDTLDTGYVYSGKSSSPTLLLTENWLLDQYDNLDESAAAQRAGLFVASEQITVHAAESLQVFGIFGYGTALDGDNLDDERTLGYEGDLGLSYHLYENHVRFTVLGGGLWPGGAAALLKNEIDGKAKDPQYHGQANMQIHF